MRTKNEQIKKGRNRLYQQLTDAVFGISDWLFSGRYLDFIQNYEEQEHELQQLDTKKQSFANWRNVLNQIVLGAVVIFVIYWSNGMTVSGRVPATFITAIGGQP